MRGGVLSSVPWWIFMSMCLSATVPVNVPVVNAYENSLASPHDIASELFFVSLDPMSNGPVLTCATARFLPGRFAATTTAAIAEIATTISA